MLYQIKIILLFVIYYGCALEEGSFCTDENDNWPGVCKRFTECFKSADEFKRNPHRTTCGFKGDEIIVCCVNATKPNVNKTSSLLNTTVGLDPDNCPGNVWIPDKPMPQKTGSKAWDKCLEYQERLVFPCVKIDNRWIRGNQCYYGRYRKREESLVISAGGEDADLLEYPSTVLLGYGEDPETRQWLCGGVVVSERFILTAGHCIYAKTVGPVTHVAAGVLKRSDQTGDKTLYAVKRVIKHPDYRPPIKYNDIALLETDRPMHLSKALLPACLHNGFPVHDEEAVATGWGALGHTREYADTLQKVDLRKFQHEECSKIYQKQKHFKDGIDNKTQIGRAHV